MILKGPVTADTLFADEKFHVLLATNHNIYMNHACDQYLLDIYKTQTLVCVPYTFKINNMNNRYQDKSPSGQKSK